MTLIHPKLMQQFRFTRHSLGTVAHRSVTIDTYGAEIVTYIPDDDLTDISLYKEPASGTEVRTALNVETINMFNLVLDGYYPTIKQSDQITVNANLTYNILRVTHDDTHTFTQLTVEIVNADESQSQD